MSVHYLLRRSQRQGDGQKGSKMKNLDDAEIRNQALDELLEWASYKINDYDTSIPRLEMIKSFIKKLNEMKGEDK